MGLFSSLIKKLYRSQNLDLVIRPVRNPKTAAASEIILPNSDYSPWSQDRDFIEVFSKIRKNTLVDVYRCWELWETASQVIKSVPGDFLEVGVWKGGTAAVLTSKMAKLDPTRTVYLADTFEGVVKAGLNDSVYVGGEHRDTSIPIVQDLLDNQLKVSNYKILKGVFPDTTGSEIIDLVFSLVHIDVDVYQSSKEIFNWVWPRIAKGGVVIFDDYGFTLCDGVTKHVNEMKNDTDKLVFYNLNGHAIIIKL